MHWQVMRAGLDVACRLACQLAKRVLERTLVKGSSLKAVDVNM